MLIIIRKNLSFSFKNTEYDGKNLFKKIIIQAGEEFIYDYKYDFDNEGDWLSKTCFCNNERIDEERRIIKYY